jgi:hypothetical protein
MDENDQELRLLEALNETVKDFIHREGLSLGVLVPALGGISSNAIALLCARSNAPKALVSELLTRFFAQIEADVADRMEELRAGDGPTPPWE